MAKQINHFYEFGTVRLDATNRLLYKNDKQLPVQPRVIETLLVLVRNAQTIVDKETLVAAVWQDVVVEEGGLKRNVSLLRKALGEEGRFIETLPKRGYRFTAEVKQRWEESPFIGAEDAELILERRANWRITHVEEISQPNDTPANGIAFQPAAKAQSRWVAALHRQRITLATALVVALLVGLGVWWTMSKPEAATMPPIKSLAVLPFKNLTPHSADEHLGLGLSDVLITRLSSIKDLKVRPTSAVMKFDGKEQDALAAGQQLGVDAVLEGSLYRVGERLRITARLLRVSTQQPVWTGQFDEKSDDFLTMQNALAQQVGNLLALDLSRREKDALAKRHTESADAYQLYVTGRYHWNKRNGDGVAQAESCFRKAVAQDPNFALAYVGLADVLTMRGVYEESQSAIEKALALDDRLGEAYAARGFWKMFKGWQWDEAEADFKQAIALNPGYGTAHQWQATLLAITGRVEEAKAAMRRALEIDPLSHNFLADLGQMHYFAREYEEAERYCREALEVYPDFGFALGYLRDIYLKRGENDRAFEAEMQAHRSNYLPIKDSQTLVEQQIASGRAGYRSGGYRLLWKGNIEGLLRRKTDYFTFHSLLRNYTLLGEKERALEALEKSYDNRDFMLPFVAVDPLYDSLRAEPRFREIVRKMNLLKT